MVAGPCLPGILAASLPALVALGCAGTPREAPSTSARRPSIVLIVADDLDARSVEHMPRLGALVAAAGVRFENNFATVPLCAPSRASLLTGRYAHNHGVRHNGGVGGGFAEFSRRGAEAATLATWLKAAGYRTALLGKYLNGYPGGDPSHVPPGWNEWRGVYSDQGSNTYFNYSISENGRAATRGASAEDYETDVLAAETAALIARWSAEREPFFLLVTPPAPHLPAVPAPRHARTHEGVRAPRVPSFDEQDVSDKPAWVRQAGPLRRRQATALDGQYRKRLQSLLALDELVERVVGALSDAGRLHDSYVFFTSDNGYFLGEHRIAQGKAGPYEESVRVPLLVRGPALPAGTRLRHLVANIDLAPTLAEIAGAKVPASLDGRSFVPLLATEPPDIEAWRRELLLELWSEGEAAVPEYQALRTQERVYIEYATGERELYDLDADPFQLDNRYGGASAEVVAPLAARLASLRACAGRSCR
jgi:N-acetylglucosamine-6-sulfatase